MKPTHFMLGICLFSSALVCASPKDELLSAQQTFRQLLANQSGSDKRIKELQAQLNAAQQRKMSADADVEKLTALLQAAQQQKQQQDAQLQQAGERLNAAWQAVRE